jgi:ketosteroid isomerase-like protein
MSDLQVVKDVYERFGRGDIPSLLALFDAAIEWRLAEGHPYSPNGEVWIGPQAVAENFFIRAGGEWENWTMAIHEFHEAADAVVVECRYKGVYKPTGKNMDIQVCHVWKVTDGRIKSFQQYIDTARLQEIMSAGTGQFAPN